MTIYAVINNSSFVSYKERYRLFTDKDKAINHAKSLGLSQMVVSMMPNKLEVGMAYITDDIMLIRLETE